MENLLAGLSWGTVFLFALVVLPGFIAQRVYELFVAAPDRNAADNLFLGLAYGVVNATLTWPLLIWAVPILTEANLSGAAILAYVAVLFSLVVAPALIGYVTYLIRDSKWLASSLTPARTSWDSFFSRRESCWIVCHLKNGARVAGYYGPESHASAFPNEQDLYLAQLWRLDEHDKFAEQIERSMGALVRRSDCDVIEFFVEG